MKQFFQIANLFKRSSRWMILNCSQSSFFVPFLTSYICQLVLFPCRYVLCERKIIEIPLETGDVEIGDFGTICPDAVARRLPEDLDVVAASTTDASPSFGMPLFDLEQLEWREMLSFLNVVCIVLCLRFAMGNGYFYLLYACCCLYCGFLQLSCCYVITPSLHGRARV